jgi:hypothetical protein
MNHKVTKLRAGIGKLHRAIDLLKNVTPEERAALHAEADKTLLSARSSMLLNPATVALIVATALERLRKEAK